MRYIYTQKRSNFYNMDVKTVTVTEYVCKYKLILWFVKVLFLLWKNRVGTWLHIEEKTFMVCHHLLFLTGYFYLFLCQPLLPFSWLPFSWVVFVLSLSSVLDLWFHWVFMTFWNLSEGVAPDQRYPSHGGSSGNW